MCWGSNGAQEEPGTPLWEPLLHGPLEQAGLAPPQADSHNPSSNPRGQDRCSVSLFPRS